MRYISLNVWVIFLFKDGASLLRVDTSNPLTSAEQLEKLVKILLTAAQTLELKAGEGTILKAEEARTVIHESAVVIDGKALDGAIGLELEEEEISEEKPDIEN